MNVVKTRFQAVRGHAKGDAVDKRNFSHWITSPIRPCVGADKVARRPAPNRAFIQGDFVVSDYELVYSEQRQDSVLVFNVPLDTPIWDGEELSLVLLKHEVVLIRNGQPWLLRNCPPAHIGALPPGLVFIETSLWDTEDRLTVREVSTGWIVRPEVQ